MTWEYQGAPHYLYVQFPLSRSCQLTCGCTAPVQSPLETAWTDDIRQARPARAQRFLLVPLLETLRHILLRIPVKEIRL